MRLEVLIITLLAVSFIIASGVNAQVAFSTVPWQISYSKYRLWYEVYIPYNITTGVYINFSVPKTVLDDVAKYCYDHNYTRCDILFPRLYYYNETSGQQIEMDTGLISTTSWYVYNNTTYYPMNFTLFYPYNLTQGYHYFVIYYPWYFWEDWENSSTGTYSTTVGSCLPDDWCVVSRAEHINIYIERPGFNPTPKRKLHLYAITYWWEYWVPISYLSIKRDIDLIVNPNYPLYLSFNYSGNGGCIGVEYLLKDGSTVTLVYSYGRCNNAGFINVCNTTTISGSEIKRDVLKDLAKYCYITPESVKEISAIYLNIAATPRYSWSNNIANMYIDNIQLIPADLSNYYP